MEFRALGPIELWSAGRRQDLGPARARSILVMLLLVGIWALTGHGYFWPVWPGIGWGFAVGVHGVVTYSFRSA